MDHLTSELQEAVEKWDQRGWPRPQVMVVTGSGLASTDLGKRVAGPVSWGELLPFPVWGIEGHPLAVELFEPVEGRVVLFSRGRLHAYQGYTPAQVVFTVRLAALLGAKVLILTNSSGGLRADQKVGELMLLRDHINRSGLNPLYGVFPQEWGPQFPDMASAYNPGLRQRILDLAGEIGIEMREGVYVSVLGPSYETPAEVAMFRNAGADAVGMSTALEIIAGHHMGLTCGAISLISNPAAGVTDEVLDHADVLERGKTASVGLTKLLARLLVDPDLV